jgi:hypothetical protein
MTGDFTLHLPKLAADGSNWITYHNHIKWTITMRGLGDHLTHDKVTQKYKDTSKVGGLKPEQRWTADKIAVNQILSVTIPDLVFNLIKTTYEPKDVWEKLKTLYEWKSRSIWWTWGRSFRTCVVGRIMMYVLTSKSLLICTKGSPRMGGRSMMLSTHQLRRHHRLPCQLVRGQ